MRSFIICTDAGYDDMVCIYTKISSFDDFIAEADITVNQFLYEPEPNNQEGFGLFVRETVKRHPVNGLYYSNMAAVGGYYGRNNLFGRSGIRGEDISRIDHYYLYRKVNHPGGFYEHDPLRYRVSPDQSRRYHLSFSRSGKEFSAKMTDMEGNDVLLFECKDIRISGVVIESHDYEAIINEYKNKLFYKCDKKNKVHRIGITQLTGHIESIRKGKFKWCHVNEGANIYPVLVISDYKNVKMGFNVISNEWYQSSLNELEIVNENNKPLIVMSFITLFKYNHLFKKNGFKYYFDMYINSFSRNQKDIIRRYQTFDNFMSQYPYHLYDLEIMVQKILNNKVKRNELSINK